MKHFEKVWSFYENNESEHKSVDFNKNIKGFISY